MEGKHTIRIAKQFPGYNKKAFRKLLNSFEGLDKMDFFVKWYYNLGLIHSLEELFVLFDFLQIQEVIFLKESAEDVDTKYFDGYFNNSSIEAIKQSKMNRLPKK